MSSTLSADEVHTSPSRVDPATWARKSRALITQLENPQDRTALRRRLTETHNDAISDITESQTDPAAIAAAELYGYLTEI
jgi:hypothetical protein